MEVLVSLVFFGLFLFVWYNKMIKPDVIESRRKKFSCFAKYEDSVLFLEHRTNKLANALKIKKYQVSYISYEPEKYVYTSATVGGITTGGVHKEEGYNYVSAIADTGKYQIEYLGEVVRKIHLSKELYQKALKSEIKEYLSSEQEIIVVIPVELSYSTMLLLKNKMMNQAMSEHAMDAKKGYPDYEKCKKILNWICVNNENFSEKK